MSARVPLRRLAATAYRAAARVPGQRALDRALASGLPDRLERPLRWLLGDRPDPAEVEVAARIESRRAALAGGRATYRYVRSESPLGFVRWPVLAEGDGDVRDDWLATAASVPRRWGIFLRRCAAAGQARTVVELGAGLGLSGAYLASAPTVERFVAVEGSPDLAAVARATYAGVTGRARVVEGFFADVLPTLLRELAAPVDLLYVDGHHDRAATLHYVEAVVPHLSPAATVVLDDVALYEEMRAAWGVLLELDGPAATVHLGRMGVLAWEPHSRARVHLDLARATGWWRDAGRREDVVPGASTP